MSVCQRQSEFPFLSSLMGHSLAGESPETILEMTRLHKYLFYELIASSESVAVFRETPRASEFLEKALLWYFNYLSLFVRAGHSNPELDELIVLKKPRLLDWKDWFADRQIFLKGLSWQRII